jgi:hypothetical protein
VSPESVSETGLAFVTGYPPTMVVTPGRPVPVTHALPDVVSVDAAGALGARL